MKSEQERLRSPMKVASDCLTAIPSPKRLVILRKDKSLWVMELSGGIRGYDENTQKPQPRKLMDHVVYVSTGIMTVAAVRTDGTLWIWDDRRFHGKNGGLLVEPVKLMENVKAAEMAEDGIMILMRDGTLLSRQKGQPETSKILEQVCRISPGTGHYAAIKQDGSLWMWGKNDCGQLGDGTYCDHPEPRKVMENVTRAALGARHSVALCRDGTLWTWGDNTFGQLGTVLPGKRRKPIRVFSHVKTVSAGYSHTGAVRSDGSLWMWGFNGKYGALGNGSMVNRRRPVRLGKGIKNISLKGDRSAATRKNGDLLVWG